MKSIKPTTLTLGAALVAGALLLGGCQSVKYTTPGGPADFRALGLSPAEAESMTDYDIGQRLARKPAASFPAAIALVRVQGEGYRSYTSRGRGSGPYSIITTRDAESDTDVLRLTQMPNTRGIGAVNRLIIPAETKDLKDLRLIGADLQADIILVYTFDTEFGSTETTIPALGVLTLGLFPNERARVTSTASAAFVDTRTGYLYGLAEATVEDTRITNAWGNNDAVDKSRREAERGAFEKLVPEIERLWADISAMYGPKTATPAASVTPTAPTAAATP
jgi:hypothetical protein